MASTEDTLVTPTPSNQRKNGNFLGGQRGDRGCPYRGLSVEFLVNDIMTDLRAGPDDTVRTVFCWVLAKGAEVPDPGSPEKFGAAYVDVAEDEFAGMSNLMLSYTWSYKLCDIVFSLANYCTEKKLELPSVKVWICFCCVNQHRVEEEMAAGKTVDFDEFRLVFATRVHTIGRVLGLLVPWNRPLYVSRVWCLYEAWAASNSMGVEMEFALPAKQRESFLAALSNRGLEEVHQALSNVKVERAEATVPADREGILSLIRNGGGYKALDQTIRKVLQRWFVDTASTSPDIINLDSFSPPVCLNLAQYLALIGDETSSRRITEHGIDFAAKIGATAGIQADFLLRLGRCCGTQGDQVEALRHCNRALTMCKEHSRQIGSGKPLHKEAGILQTIASIERKGGELLKSVESYQRSLAIHSQYRTEGGLLPVDGGWILMNLGIGVVGLETAGQEAPPWAKTPLEYFNQALELYEVHGQGQGPAAANILRHRGELLTGQGKLSEADADLKKASSLYEQMGQQDSENNGEVRRAQGLLFIEQGETAAAAAALGDALRILRNKMAPELALIGIIGDLAQVYTDRADTHSRTMALRAQARACDVLGFATVRARTGPPEGTTSRSSDDSKKRLDLNELCALNDAPKPILSRMLNAISPRGIVLLKSKTSSSSLPPKPGVQQPLVRALDQATKSARRLRTWSAATRPAPSAPPAPSDGEPEQPG